MKRLYECIQPVRKVLLIGMLFKAVSTMLDLGIPYVMGIVIDQGVLTEETAVVLQGGGLILLMAILSLLTTIIAHKFAVRASETLGEDVRNKLYQHIQQMKIKDVEEISTGALITRVTGDVEHVQRTVQMTARLMVRAPMMVIGGLTLSFILDAYLTAVLLVAMAILAVVSKFIYSITRPLYRKVQKNMDQLTSTLRENIGGIQSIKAFNKAEYEIGRVNKQSKEMKRFELKAGTINGVLGPSITLITNIAIIGVLYMSSIRVHGGNLEIGKVVTVINYINMIMMGMSVMPRMMMMLNRANVSLGRIEEIFDKQDTITYGEKQKSSNTSNLLEVKNLSFSYENSQHEVLQDINFTIKEGETVGIIGGTGSGKTTLIQLILRLYEPTSGEILLEGESLENYDKSYFKEQVTASIQQYHLLSMSIKENILLDQPLDEMALHTSISSSQTASIIQDLEKGIEHNVAQEGHNLSGGQKQRINIARSLYRKSRLILLDDVSSALDYKTDFKLRQAIQKNYKDRSLVIASQRISSVRDADKIIVLEEGCIIGIGTHTELLETCEVYSKMSKVQEGSVMAI